MNWNRATRVSPTTNVPPKQSDMPVTRKEEVSKRKTEMGVDVCPAHEACKSVGNFYPGICTKNATAPSQQRCQVSQILLLNKTLKGK